MTPNLKLQIVFAWQRHLLGYRLLSARDRVTLGSAKGVTFVAPLPAGFPRRFAFVRPVSGGHRLRVGPGMSGQVHLRVGGIKGVDQILAEPAPRKILRKDRGFRDVDLGPGDAGAVYLDDACQLKLQFSFVDPPEAIERPRLGRTEPFLVRSTIGTTVGLLVALAALMIFAPRDTSDDIAITPEKFVKMIEPALTPKVKAAVEESKKEGERKRKEREAAMSKRMKGDEGKLGRKEAPNKDTVIPKGREDILREKVQKTGLLAALGTARASGSGLGRLLTNNNDSDLDQAVTGLEGAKLAVGRGSGGLGVAGTGLGGGGTGFGHIQGSGDVDVGAGRGRGRKGPGLGAGKEKEVSVGMSTGKSDADGGLSREQVERVVKSHQAAVRYCYEKEYQRKPDLSGTVKLYWVIRPNGVVDKVKTETSTLDNHDAESCMERQVKNWQFPKSSAETIVRFPFIFKGGGA